MKVIARNGQDFPIYTPQEIVEKRQLYGTNKRFNDYGVLNPDIAQKIANIYTIHGFTYHDHALELCFLITNELSAQYNFQYGYQYIFGDSRIPSNFQGDEESTKRFLEYTRLILEAFGWIVNFSEDQGWYIFNFTPLLSFTPDEVKAEIKKRTDRIAGHAVQTINKGLLHHKNIFHIDNLGLSNINPMDYILALNTITELMGPSWSVIDKRDFTIYVTPTTPN